MPSGAFTAARHLAVSDTEIATGTGYQDYKTLRTTRGEQFTPQAVHIDRSSDTDEDGLGYASIDGFLVGENETHRKTWRVVTHMPVGLAFARVYNTANTTARGISLLEEV